MFFNNDPLKFHNIWENKIKHRNVDSGNIVKYNDFKIVYHLFCFDVSKHWPNIYASGSTAHIEMKLLLDDKPGNPYNIYCFILSEKNKTNMDVIDHKLHVKL